MYKFIAALLGIVVLVGGGAFAWQNYQWSKQRRELNNQLAITQGMQQETETAVSRLAIEREKLKANNRELQQKIEDRDEEVLAKTQAEVKWKNRYFKSINAQQSVVDSEGNEIVPTEESPQDACSARIKVDFQHEEEPLLVTGHTLTNPPYAEVSLEWSRGLQLSLVLTKNDDDTFRVYLDSENSDVVPTELKLEVDPSLLDLAWYERIGFGADLAAGEFGGLLNLRAFWEFSGGWYLGPNFTVLYDGTKAKTFYGVTAGWYPFR